MHRPRTAARSELATMSRDGSPPVGVKRLHVPQLHSSESGHQIVCDSVNSGGTWQILLQRIMNPPMAESISSRSPVHQGQRQDRLSFVEIFPTDKMPRVCLRKSRTRPRASPVAESPRFRAASIKYQI